MTSRAFLLVTVCACGVDPTRVHIDVTAGSVALDSYQLGIGDRSALGDPLPALDVLVPDAMAGQDQTLQIWGCPPGGRSPSAARTSRRSCTAAPSGGDARERQLRRGAPTAKSRVQSDGTIVRDASNGCLGWSAIERVPARDAMLLEQRVRRAMQRRVRRRRNRLR
jgi:hypothetical protein